MNAFFEMIVSVYGLSVLFFVAQEYYSVLGRLAVEVSRSHTDTPHSVGLL